MCVYRDSVVAILMLGCVRNDPAVRSALVQEVRNFMLESDDHWESIAEHGAQIHNLFSSSKKGRKAEVLSAFEQQANSAGKRAYYPSLLQIVYRSGSRQHVLMNRWARLMRWLLLCCTWGIMTCTHAHTRAYRWSHAISSTTTQLLATPGGGPIDSILEVLFSSEYLSRM